MAANSNLPSAEAVSENTNKQLDAGDAKESFKLTEWLSKEVKLPQYCDAFLEQGFEFPSECYGIDENVLDLLGIEKIGHRKRILVSCQKLADRYGLTNDIVTPAKTSDYGVTTTPSLSDAINQSDEGDAAPALPPKKGKMSKPAPPPRVPLADESAVSIEQEVHVNETFTTISSGENSDSSSENCSELLDSTNLKETQSKPLEKDKKTSDDVTNQAKNSTATDSTPAPGLPPGSSDIDIAYEPMWEASEGTPEAVSPKKTMQESCNSSGMLAIVDIDEIVVDSKPTESPPPIPPRADLDDTKDQDIPPVPPHSNLEYKVPWQVCGDNTAENSLNLQPEPVGQNTEEKQSILRKKVAPKKPPRQIKPVSMLLQPVILTEEWQTNDKCSPGSPEGAVTYMYMGDEREVFDVSSSNEKEPIADQNIKRKIEDTINLGNDNIYDNAEEMQKFGRRPLLSIDEGKSSSPRKPIPVPRSKSLSGAEMKKPSHSAVQSVPELPKTTEIVSPAIGTDTAPPDAGGECGSCTEDDLSGSDPEDLETDKEKDEKKTKENEVNSAYETVNFPPRISMFQSRTFFKEGYLYKQGGKQNNKGWNKRWVVFDGKELCYYKDKEHTNESLQRVPVANMIEVRLVTEDTRRARFDLTCKGRTYVFALDTDEMSLIQMWAQIFMGAIINCMKDNAESIPGGSMGEPDKQGFLKKQGNSVVADWKKRYVVIKEDKFACYHNYEDFIHATPIDTLHMNLASAKEDPKSQSRFQLVTPHRMYIFQCDDEREVRSWIGAFKKAIQLALSDRTVVNKIWENPSNRYCADCGRRDPVWASVNLVVCVCEHCIGVHRKLGVYTSKPRSLLMDEKIWKPSLIKLMVDVGNEVSNGFWKFRFPEDDQIDPDCTSEVREEFIRNKYVEKRYRHVSSLYGDAVALGEALRNVVVTDAIEETMQLLFSAADIKYVPADGSDTRTPYELAKDANQENQVEFLLQNGANTAEPEAVAGGSVSDSIYEDPDYFLLHSSGGTVTYEKKGFLQKKSPSAAVWKRRLFKLKGRELLYEKGDKEDPGIIKLKDVIEYVYNDTVTLDIVTKDRTYNLRADTKEDARSWFTFLRNKQVFQIPLINQELGSDGIPHLVAKCLQFIESHGMDAQGIYRKNGNKAKIKHLKRLFDQDAESIILSQEEYEVHDVAGLLKEYFRELPDPLMTEDAYAHFITASLSHDHNRKLYSYKESLERLADVNRNTLKAVIGHLKRVSLQSDKNLMKLENVSLIFGPTLMSNKQTGGMDTNTINQEFTVINDFVNFYKWLFDVGEDEEKKEKVMEDAIEKMNALMKTSQNSQSEVTELTLDIYSLDRTHESSRITVYSYSKASEICQKLVSKRALAPDGTWGLFQVVNKEQERPFPATEKVLATIIETGKYSQMSKDSCLIVKENYVSRIMNTYGFQDDSTLTAGNMLQTMKEAKKKESWKKLFLSLENGCLSVYKNVKSKDVTDSWPVNEATLYIGIDKDKKPPSTFGFTIVRSMKDDHCIYRYICFENEYEQYRWISIFLKLKYPGQNMWVDPDLQPIGYYAEAMIPGRISKPLKQKSAGRHGTGGVSANVMNELRKRQESIKK